MCHKVTTLTHEIVCITRLVVLQGFNSSTTTSVAVTPGQEAARLPGIWRMLGVGMSACGLCAAQVYKSLHNFVVILQDDDVVD
jgi:hypothetical protein